MVNRVAMEIQHTLNECRGCADHTPPCPGEPAPTKLRWFSCPASPQPSDLTPSWGQRLWICSQDNTHEGLSKWKGPARLGAQHVQRHVGGQERSGLTGERGEVCGCQSRPWLPP